MKKQKKTEPETAARRIVKEDLPVQGLDCADCAQLLEKAVCKVKGVVGAQADFIKSSLRVEYTPGQVQPGEIILGRRGVGHPLDGRLRRYGDIPYRNFKRLAALSSRTIIGRRPFRGCINLSIH